MTTTQQKPKAPDQTVKLPDAVVRAAARSAELVEQQRLGGSALPNNGATMAFADVNSETPPVANANTTPATPATPTSRKTAMST